MKKDTNKIPLRPIETCTSDYERIKQACESIFRKTDGAIQAAYFYRRELVAYRTAIDSVLNTDPAAFAIRDRIVANAKKHIALLEAIDDKSITNLRESVHREINRLVEAELRKIGVKPRRGSRKAKGAK